MTDEPKSPPPVPPRDTDALQEPPPFEPDEDLITYLEKGRERRKEH
jgi:hypothetical protein